MQQIIHVCRNVTGRKKSKKMSCLHLQSAASAAQYFSHKAQCIDEGLFEQLEIILKVEGKSVNETLKLIDDEGFSRSRRVIKGDASRQSKITCVE
jgi:hypothetical protein